MKKAVEKVEMKESLLKGEALALNDAELEGAAGGAGDRETFEQRMRNLDNWRLRPPIEEKKTRPEFPPSVDAGERFPRVEHPEVDYEELKAEVSRARELMDSAANGK